LAETTKAVWVKSGGSGQCRAANLASGDNGVQPLDQIAAHSGRLSHLNVMRKMLRITMVLTNLKHALQIARKNVDLDIALLPLLQGT